MCGMGGMEGGAGAIKEACTELLTGQLPRVNFAEDFNCWKTRSYKKPLNTNSREKFCIKQAKSAA
jgi:hypothetical protein